MITKEDVDVTIRLLDKFYEFRLDEIQKKYPELNVYDIDPIELWDLDDGDCLIEGITTVEAALSGIYSGL